MLKKMVCSLSMVVVCIASGFFPPHAFAYSGEEQVIRVAIPAPDQDIDEQAHLEYVEYTKEYLHEISQYTGWQYEVIEVPGTYQTGIENVFQMLQQGQADLAAPVQYHEELAQAVHFSQSAYALNHTVLQVPNAVYNGLSVKNEIRVAALTEKEFAQSAANEFFKKNNYTVEYVMCQDTEEQIRAVCSGQADVMLNSTMEFIPNMSVIAEFGQQPLFFAAKNEQLLDELDSAIIHIN